MSWWRSHKDEWYVTIPFFFLFGMLVGWACGWRAGFQKSCPEFPDKCQRICFELGIETKEKAK